MSIRILIVDDDATIRLLMGRLIERQPDWQLCGEASNGAEAIEKVEQLSPDLVIMDLSMPDMNGLQPAREITKTHPHLPLLLISVQEVSQQLVREACNAGYKGVVTKSRGRVIKGVAALLGQQTFFYVQDGSASDEQESRNCQPCLARH